MSEESGSWSKCVCIICWLPCVWEVFPYAVVDATEKGLLNVDTMKM
jgi:hypothetical protein